MKIQTPMKKQVAIWMDHEKAILLHPEGKNIRRETIESEYDRYPRIDGEESDVAIFGKNRVSNNEFRKNNKLKNELKDYFSAVEEKVKPYDYIALWGPGPAKKQLCNFLKEKKQFQDADFDLEDLDKLTENQLDAKAKLFFKMNKK